MAIQIQGEERKMPPPDEGSSKELGLSLIHQKVNDYLISDSFH